MWLQFLNININILKEVELVNRFQRRKTKFPSGPGGCAGLGKEKSLKVLINILDVDLQTTLPQPQSKNCFQ